VNLLHTLKLAVAVVKVRQVVTQHFRTLAMAVLEITLIQQSHLLHQQAFLDITLAVAVVVQMNVLAVLVAEALAVPAAVAVVEVLTMVLLTLVLVAVVVLTTDQHLQDQALVDLD
jgi:hypothetical protein